LIASLWGIEGSGKSTVALTYPKPLFHMDLDLGGFDRAAWRVIQEAKKEGVELRVRRCDAGEDISVLNWNELDIVSKPYLAPVQMEKLMGVQKTPGVSVRFPRAVKGVKELWQEIVIDLVALCQTRIVRSIVIDSATQLWWVAHTSLLQEKQEIQLAKPGFKESDPLFRERLQPMEFPNDRMRSLIYTARSSGKNLVMTHYPKDVYKERVGANGVESYKSGEVEPDGFKHTVTLDDIVIWCYTEIDKRKNIMTGVENPNYNKPQPYAKIDLKCGLEHMGMAAVGLELPSPSYEGLMELQAMMKGE